MKLVIFDLDQTLVDLFAVHDKAYHRTMKGVFGIKAYVKRHILPGVMKLVPLVAKKSLAFKDLGTGR
jgi:beta-phosphoglucomutase-like phosphatase (HAD superfamily)